MLNFTNNVINQAYENFMKQIPGFHREPAEAKVIQKDIEQQKTGTATLVDTGDVHAMMIGQQAWARLRIGSIRASNTLCLWNVICLDGRK